MCLKLRSIFLHVASSSRRRQSTTTPWWYNNYVRFVLHAYVSYALHYPAGSPSVLVLDALLPTACGHIDRCVGCVDRVGDEGQWCSTLQQPALPARSHRHSAGHRATTKRYSPTETKPENGMEMGKTL